MAVWEGLHIRNVRIRCCHKLECTYKDGGSCASQGMNTNDSALYGIEYEESSAIESEGDGSLQAVGDARGVTYAVSGTGTVNRM